ncbi:MAG: septum formation initiator family protein [Prevotellaceae bacterium]|jgi:cell division protein FtsB|nr:septum formation initiator family protein [Prevotellaceae bacterium]
MEPAKWKLPKFVRNQYFLTFLAFILWVTLFDRVSIPLRFKQRSDNRKIEQEIEILEKKILELEKTISAFKTSADSIEKFAREHYFMKRDDEVIYTLD